MIKAAESEWVRKVFYQLESNIIFPLHFKNINISKIPIYDNHSILLIQNHISWWDGFWGNYLAYHFLHRKYYVMVQEDQMKKHPLLKYRGAFSIRKQSREALESIQYASSLLQNPRNMVLIFPQGRLQSMHVRNISVEKGLYRLMEKLDSNCQVIFNSVVIDYLESFKPRVKLNLFDCGPASQLDLKSLEEMISHYHRQSLEKSIRK